MRQLLIRLPIVLAVTFSALAQTAVTPDFSGTWARPYVGFEPPISGPGPVLNRSRVNGQSNLNQFSGDYANPILKPNAAEAIKRHAEIEIAGATAPNPSNQCRPMPPPYILQRQQMQFVQQPHQITILYAEDEQVRHVRLNARHPEHVTPSWYGDSIGHFEGDTLVVDTIGLNDKTPVDVFNTPHTTKEHVVERIRVVHMPNGQKNLEVRFTVDDPGAFTTAWTGVETYRGVGGTGGAVDPIGGEGGVLQEEVCAENNTAIGIPEIPIPEEKNITFR